jgi:hypothetical protein
MIPDFLQVAFSAILTEIKKRHYSKLSNAFFQDKTFRLVIALPATRTQDRSGPGYRHFERIVGLHGHHIFFIQVELASDFFGVHTFVCRNLRNGFLKILMIHSFPLIII